MMAETESGLSVSETCRFPVDVMADTGQPRPHLSLCRIGRSVLTKEASSFFHVNEIGIPSSCPGPGWRLARSQPEMGPGSAALGKPYLVRDGEHVTGCAHLEGIGL